MEPEDILPHNEFDDQYRLVQLMSELNDKEAAAMIESLVWMAKEVLPARLQGKWHNESEKQTYVRIADLIIDYLN